MEILFKNFIKTEKVEQEKSNIEKPLSDMSLDILKNETKILDSEGNPVLMYNRSNNDFENFEIGKRNLPNKSGFNKFGFFFSNRNDLDHYGPFIKSRYLNIKNPWDIRDLGNRTEYKNFRAKLIELGVSDKDLAGFDLGFQDLYIERNKKLGSSDGFSKLGMNETRMATFNFFDAGSGYYLRKLLTDKGIDGVLFEDEGDLTAIAFNPEQIVDPKEIEFNSQLN
jgi:hypothetical protein